MLSYTLQDILVIKESMTASYILSPETLNTIISINENIQPIIFENEKKYDNTINSKQVTKRHDQLEKHKDRFREKLSWKRIEEFKVTTFEKPLKKTDQIIQQIKMSFNKISIDNYEKHLQIIIIKINEVYDEDICNKEKNVSQVVTIFFDIIGFNHFFSVVYAKLFKDLLNTFPEFKDYMTLQFNTYPDTLKDIIYVDPEKNYELLCKYNKEKDIRKSFGKFFVNLMKNEVIPYSHILSVIISLQNVIIEIVEIDGQIGKVDELTDVLYTLLQEGKEYFKCNLEWKSKCLPMIQTFGRFKKNEKQSLSNRAIFKFMDILTIVDN
jgi:hypothetical protein